MDTVGKNKAKIAEYIRDQLKEDQIHDQMTLREFVDPFTGSREQSPCWCQTASTPLGVASIIGLCPHMKYPRLRRGIYILLGFPAAVPFSL